MTEPPEYLDKENQWLWLLSVYTIIAGTLLLYTTPCFEALTN